MGHAARWEQVQGLLDGVGAGSLDARQAGTALGRWLASVPSAADLRRARFAFEALVAAPVGSTGRNVRTVARTAAAILEGAAEAAESEADASPARTAPYAAPIYTGEHLHEPAVVPLDAVRHARRAAPAVRTDRP